ncbi:MAG: thioredoxin family protein [Bacteroidota bacterium]
MVTIRLLLFSMVVFVTAQGISQESQNSENDTSKVEWMDFETALEKQKDIPKPIFVDLYTDWCGWCKKLDKETFSNPTIANYLNTNFYPVKFDAEGNDTIEFKGETYVNSSKGRRPTHELALLLTNNKPSYPSMIFINEEGKPNIVNGFMDVKKIQPILVFFAEQVYKTCPFEKFTKAFSALYQRDEEVDINMSGEVEWLSLEEALDAQLKEEKKILVFFYSDTYHSVSSNLTQKVILKDPHIASYINSNYYPVFFDAARTDTIKMFDQTFVNEQLAPSYPHQFVFATLQKNVVFPSILFIDKDRQLLSPMQGYFPKTTVEPYLHFIAEDKYKDTDWQEYYGNFDGKIKKAEAEKTPGNESPGAKN